MSNVTQGVPGPGLRAGPSRQFVRFLLVGGTAAGVNFFSRMLYSHWVDYAAAIVLAYVSGMLVAFPLFRRYVFTQSSQPWQRSVLIFSAVHLVAVAQTWAVSMGLLYLVLPRLGVLRWAPEISHAAGIVVPVFSSFIGHKHGSFR